LSGQGRDPRGRGRRPLDLRPRSRGHDQRRRSSRDGGLDALRGLDAAWTAVDDAAARPGVAEPGTARAEAGVRSLPHAGRPAAARGRAGAIAPLDYLDRLAEFVPRTSCATLPAPVIAAARLVLLDTLGAMLAGSRLP